MKLAYNVAQANGSSTMFLQKAHVKLCLQVDKSGRIPIKKWVSWFSYFSLCFLLHRSFSPTRHVFSDFLFHEEEKKKLPRANASQPWTDKEMKLMYVRAEQSHPLLRRSSLSQLFFYWFCNQPFPATSRRKSLREIFRCFSSDIQLL